MKVLVTGAGGFIGRHLTNELREHGHSVIGTDAEPPYTVDGPMLEVHGDMTSELRMRAIMQTVKPEVVIHLAAQVGRVFGEDDRLNTVTRNAVGTMNVAVAATEVGARLFYVSTSEVYGDLGERVATEGDAMRLPHNLYGLSKRWGEEVAQLYMPTAGYQCARLSMPYGTGVAPGRGRAAINNVLWQAATGQRIPIHRGAERSWCWVGDTVAALRLIMERGIIVRNATHADAAVYNVGRDDDARPMVEVAELACKLVGASPGLIDLVDAPNAQTVVKRLSTDKLRGLGWSPTVDLEDGMRSVLAWVRKYGRDGQRIA
jgi:nucleoside-diphosphate-sugar epimerase